jgi:hypothetical protein
MLSANNNRRIVFSDSILVKLAILYLALPYLLFFFGWLRKPIAAVLSGILLISYWLVWRKIDQEGGGTTSYLQGNKSWLFLAILVLGIWLILAGAGHFADQVGDYKKHNLILSHLIHQPWPVVQHITDKNAYVLVYYLAYYLPAGLFGKVFGLLAANVFQYFFTLLGLLLAFFFFLSFARGKKPTLAALIFILFGGMDLAGWLILKGKFPVLGEYIYPWSQSLSYQGMTDILFFVPQQALPGWIVTGVFLWSLTHKKGFGYLIFIWSLTFLWAPWISIGLLPLLAWTLLSNLSRWKDFVTIANIVPVLVNGIVLGIYYSTNQSSLGYNGWAWDFTVPWVSTYLVFILVEFLVLALCIGLTLRTQKPLFSLLWVAVIPLLFIPFYHSGVFNDFCMRASIPSLTILMMLSMRVILNPGEYISNRIAKVSTVALCVILVIGSVYAFSRLASTTQNTIRQHGGFFYPYSETYESNLFDSFNNIPSDIILEQYLARNVDYPKYQWLFKY